MLVVVTLFVSTFGLSSAQENWELVKSKKGVDVFAREVAGADIKQFKAEYRFKSNANDIVELIKDPAKCVKWVSDCATSKAVGEQLDHQFSIYRKIDNPWPFKDSDYVLTFNVAEENNTTTINFEDANQLAQSNKCCNRMPMIKGVWQIEQDNEYVNITFTYHFDPGVKVPAGLVNAAFPDMPIEQLTNIKTLLAGS